jgi:hypothetical protein
MSKRSVTGALFALGFASACNLISGVGGLSFQSSTTSGASVASSTSGSGGSQGPSGSGGGGQGPGSGGADADGGSKDAGDMDAGGKDAGDMDAGSDAHDAGTEDAPSGPPTAAQLLAVVDYSTCTKASTEDYYNDINPTSMDIHICALNGAVLWVSGLSIDCDGSSSTSPDCPSSSNETAATDSNGNYLDSLTLPFVVLPGNSGCNPLPWSYSSDDISYGDVIAVIYNNTVSYGVFGDTGDCSHIGQASYAMASSLGIDPGPANAGAQGNVTFIAFKGTGALVSPIEDHTTATTLGQMLAAKLLTDN